MLRSDWGIGSAVIALLLIGLPSLGLIQHQRSNDGQTSNNAAQEEAKERKPEFCIGKGVPPPICTLDGKPSSERKEWREEQDLDAQRIMAFWTRIMGGFAGIAFFLSCLGVFLIWRNLKATRDALAQAGKTTQATREIGEAEVTAYVQPMSLNVKLQDSYIEVAASTKIYGQTAALDLKLQCAIEITKIETGNIYIPIKARDYTRPHAFDEAIFLCQKFKYPNGLDFDKKPRGNANRPIPPATYLNFKIKGFVEYKNVFGGIYQSQFEFIGNWNGPLEIPESISLTDDTAPRYFQLVSRKERNESA